MPAPKKPDSPPGIVGPPWEPRFRPSLVGLFLSLLVLDLDADRLAPRNALERCETQPAEQAGWRRCFPASSTAGDGLPYAIDSGF